VKPFPEHNPEWVRSLPYWEHGLLFPNSRCHKREDIEGGWTFAPDPPRAFTADEIDMLYFNHTMSEQTAAFADIIGRYTRWTYGLERTIAILRILSVAWRARGEADFGTRVWFHKICREATPIEEFA
jgi:hypothetical protein